MDGGRPPHRHLLRPHRALLLHGVAPVAAALGAGALVRPEQAVHRLAFLAFCGAAAAVVWGPLLGTGPEPRARTAAAAAGLAATLPACAAVWGGDAGGALAAGLAVAAFLVLLSGTARGAGRLLRSPARGLVLSAALGACFAASFHLGDPFLEWGGSGAPSRLALGILHWVNPLSGAVGDGLSLDWLRFPIMYSGLPGTVGGGLSAAQYYRFSYAPWWGILLAHGGAGSLLLALPRRRR